MSISYIANGVDKNRPSTFYEVSWYFSVQKHAAVSDPKKNRKFSHKRFQLKSYCENNGYVGNDWGHHNWCIRISVKDICEVIRI